ncbi:MAG: hypothetical protein IH991_01745 [Planctomycetes bacterium]|nr:hypothetical protein [Planctomycetota bacterium]
MNTEGPSTGTRPFRRLHRSTVVVLVLTLSLFVLINLPGERRVTNFEPQWRHLQIEEELQHGWPFTYVHRECEYSIFESNYARIWRPWTSIRRFSLASLCFNVAIAVGLSVVVAALFEMRRRHRRRLLQLHMSDIFIVVTAISLMLGWMQRLYHSDRHQQQAIGKLNLTTYRPREPTDNRYLFLMHQFYDSHTERMLPTWIDELGILPSFENVIGLRITIHANNADAISEIKHFQHLRYLYLSAWHDRADVNIEFVEDLRQLRVFHPPMGIDDADARNLSNLTALEELRLDHTRLTDDAMVHLRRLTRLKSLTLPVRLSNKGLQHIGNLTALEKLHLPHTMDGADLGCLQRLTNLRELQLGWGIQQDALTGVRHLCKLERLDYLPMDLSDEGLSNLINLSNLKYLRLNERKITDQGLVYVGRLQELEFLDLSETQISDCGLVHLANLKKLKFINLSETRVTNDGLATLAELSKLEDIWLYRTPVTSNGVAKLISRLPNCEIVQ